MNRISPPLRGLYWKEIRQLIPLVLMLVGMSVFLVVAWSVIGVTTQFGSIVGDYIPLAIPALYAAGVGAILVGQEKETRTLLWCSSLPIAPSGIASVKYVVALIGLAAMWICSLVIGGFAGLIGPVSSHLVPTPGQLGPAYVLYWFLHSVFVLCCGFYTTWKFQNAFASLVAMIPIASIPYLVTQALYTLFNDGRFISVEGSAGLLSIATTVGIIVFAILGYRAALEHLSPAEAEQEEVSSGNWLGAWRPATSVPIPDSPFQFSLSSLVWQAIHHNRITLLGLVTLMLCGTICFVLTTNSYINGRYSELLAFGSIVGFLGLSWLGVFVFSGDGSTARMRFLADRGVSPTHAWLGRQFIGLSVVATISLIYAVLSYLSFRSNVNDSTGGKPILSMVSFGFVIFIVYSISQWSSQLIRVLAASAFIAPMFSLSALAYAMMTLDTLKTPWWVAALCAVIPMIATWVMMRRYMDNNLRWPVWATGFVVACLLTVMPCIPFAIEVRKWPKVSSDLRSNLVAEAMKLPLSVEHPIASWFDADRLRMFQEQSSIFEAQAIAYLDANDDSPDGLIAIGVKPENSTDPLHADDVALWQCFDAANYFKVSHVVSPQDEQNLESLGEWIAAFAVISKRLRLSDSLKDQHWADEIEIWLTRTLAMNELTSHLDRDFAKQALDVISDQASRSSSRRRAILASWRNDQLLSKGDSKIWDHKTWDHFGNFDRSQILSWFPNLKRKLLLPCTMDMLAAKLIQLVEAGERGDDTDAIRRDLHKLILEPTLRFEDGPYARDQQATVREHTTSSFNHAPAHIACQWYAPWEIEAMKLKSAQKPRQSRNE